MDITKNIRKISNIYHIKTKYNDVKRYNSPILFNKRIKNYLLVNESHRLYKNSFDLKMPKSNKNMIHNRTCLSKKNLQMNKGDEINSVNSRKGFSKSPILQKDNSRIINYIQKKITFQTFGSKITKKFSNNNFLKNICVKEKETTKILNKTKNNSSYNSTLKNIYQRNNLKKNIIKNNCINKIYLFINNKKRSTSNKCIKNKFFYNSKISNSYDSMLSKTINQNKKNHTQKSLEKNKISKGKIKRIKNKFSMNLLNNKKLKKVDNEISKSFKNNLDKNLNNNKKINLEKNKKIILEKNKKIFKQNNHEQKDNIISQNLKEIIKNLSKNDLSNKNNNNMFKTKKLFLPKKHIDSKNKNSSKNKNTDNNKQEKITNKSNKKITQYKKFNDFLNYSKENSLIVDECFNGLNDARIISENHSTNDKSLNVKQTDHPNKIKMNKTKKIFMNKYKDSKNNLYKTMNDKKNIILDNEGFLTCEFDLGNEQNNKINGVRTNNFDVKKPKEENLKFTFVKEDIESDISVSHASKIIIGNIDGYKDIIETDIKNSQNVHSKCYTNLINKKSFIFNSTNKLEEGQDDNLNINNITNSKKISNISTLLKKESEPITFSDGNFYNSINMTNNLDEISSIITNNINDNKNNQSTYYKNDDKNFKSERKFYALKNGNFNNNSFSINSEKTIKDFSKNINYNIIKNEDNFENILNRNNNNRRQKYNENNNFVNNQYKNRNLKKMKDINNNCTIF